VWLKRSRIPRTDWCTIATLFAEHAGAGRHFADSISKSLIGREIFFLARCQERSLADVVVAALQPRSRCDAMIGTCRAGKPDVSARGLRLAGKEQEVALAQLEPVMNTVVGSYVYTVLLAGRSERSDAKARPRWWRLTHASSDPYHPERYYMRGPGPKWQEKHAAKRPAR